MAAVIAHPIVGRAARPELTIDLQRTERAIQSEREIGDRQAGYVAVGMIGSLGVLLVALLTSVVLYATTWGYSIAF